MTATQFDRPFATASAPTIIPSSVGRRFIAALLDAVLAIVTLGVGWIVWSVIVWANGQTPAKALMGMRCVRADTGQTATWGTMALRELVGRNFLSWITFGLTGLASIFLVFSGSRQTIWDKVASTVVVDV